MDMHIGYGTCIRGATFDLKYPIEHGVVTNWDVMETIWRYIFNDRLFGNPKEHPVLLTEAVTNPKSNREIMAQIMFETFEVPALYIAKQPVLSVLSSGCDTGIAVEIGDGLTQVTPVYEGYALHGLSNTTEFAGSDITKYFAKSLQPLFGYSFTPAAEREVVPNIKEEFCYIALDFYKEKQIATTSSDIKRKYYYSHDDFITLNDERFRCTEALFDPSILNVSTPGIHELCNNTIKKCDKDLQKDLYKNIVLSGGNTMFPGFAERMEKEMNEIAFCDTEIKVVAPPRRKYSAWIGGSILASRPQFQQMWISREEYYESGRAIVNYKCI